MIKDQCIVLLDLGNSFAKLCCLPMTKIKSKHDTVDDIKANVAILNLDSFIQSDRINNEQFNSQALVSLLDLHKVQIAQVSDVLISSVRSSQYNDDLTVQLAKHFYGARVSFCRTSQQHGNVINEYQDIEKLGIDRWLAAIAACNIVDQTLECLHSSEHVIKKGCIVVDAGSAVTIDFIKIDEGHKAYTYCGGKILPGLKKMSQSLSKTDKLPWVNISYDSSAALSSSQGGSVLKGFGKNTQDAIVAGIKSAMMGALHHTVQELKQQGISELYVYVTGGDAQIYEPLMSQYNMAIKSHLVFNGMLLSYADKFYLTY